MAQQIETYPVMLDDAIRIISTDLAAMASTYPGGGNGVTSSRASVTYYDQITEGSSDASITNLLVGAKWGDAIGTGLSLYTSFSTVHSEYSYAPSSTTGLLAAAEVTPFAAAQITGARGAMAGWAAVSNLSFTETTDSATNAGDIRWGQTGYTGLTTAFGYYPSTWAEGGDIWFGPNSAYANPVVGSYGYHTYIHELGHALGLMHPHEGPVPAVTGEDQLKYSVMSYRSYYGDDLTGYTNAYFPTTPMLNDILAIQFLYGANMTYKTGNDTYQWDASKSIYETIWDAGGTDTIDASNQSQSVILDLNPGNWSSMGVAFWNGQSYVRDCLTIAYGASIENAKGSAYADTLWGNSANNSLIGYTGDDALYGGTGNDALNGGGGADAMTGGDGNDIYYLDNPGDVISETNASATQIDTVYSYIANHTLGANIENGRIFATGGANLTGNSLNNTLTAGAGNNVLNGGTGIDTASYQFAGSAVSVSLALATAQATGGSGSDTLAAIENLVGSNYNDTLTGNSGNNFINGGTGNDTMAGGLGNDTYGIDTLSDVVTELAGQGTDLVHSAISYSLADTDGAGVNGGNVENLKLTGTGNINGTGNSLNNVIFANAGNNILNGGTGTDTASYGYAGSAVTVSLAVAIAQATGGSGSDTLAAIENLTGSNYNDTLTGNTGANALSGGAGNDTLSAGDGNDGLYGGLGNDTLTGGSGGDGFIFNTALNGSTNKDTITDFLSGTDKIKLDDAICTAIGALGNFVAGDARFYAAAGAVAGHDADDRVVYNTTTGALYYDADGSGATAAIQIALLGISTHPGLAATDCVVI